MRRIQRDSKHEDFIKTLMSGDQPIFREIWRILLFASAIGIANEKRVPLQNVDSGKNMPDTYFNTPGWPGYIHLIGITETGNSDILRSDEKNQEQVITYFEEYANAGLEIMQDKIRGAGSPWDALVLLMVEADGKRPSAPNLTELI